MKARKGGNMKNVERLFADDPAMRVLLSGCNRDKVLSFFENDSAIMGGAPTKRRRDDEEDEMEEVMEEMRATKKQKSELEFPDKCSLMQRAIAIFASATIELMYKGASSAALCYAFPEQMQAISNIMNGFLNVVGQNVGGSGTTATIGAIVGFLYAYKTNGKVEELIGKIYSLARQPFPGNALHSIMRRAVVLCENDMIPLGRTMTIDSIKERFWNKLGDFGLGPVAESRRRQRQSELKRLQKEYAEEGIPAPPRMGMPSRKLTRGVSFAEQLQKQENVPLPLDVLLSDTEKLENARNELEFVRKEMVSTRNKKNRVDSEILKLEGSEEVIDNPAMMQFLDESKMESKQHSNKLSELLNKEQELLSKIRRLEGTRLEGTLRSLKERKEKEEQMYLKPSAPSMRNVMEASMMGGPSSPLPSDIEEEMMVVLEKEKKKSKKKKTSEGGKRRTNKKHHKKSKKHFNVKHKKSVKRHHKKTHKKY